MTEDTPAQAPEEEVALARLSPDEESFEDRMNEIRDKVSQMSSQAMTFVRERPGICIVGAVAVGYLVGRIAAKRWLR